MKHLHFLSVATHDGAERDGDVTPNISVDEPPPHVSHVVLSLEPGGLEMLICRLVVSSELQDLPTTVACLDEPGRLASQTERPGARIEVVRRRAGLDLTLILRLAKFFRRSRPDVLHTHSLDPMLYAGIAAMLARVPVRIHTQHNTWLADYSWKERLKYRVAQRFFDVIVAVSTQTDREVARYGVPRSRRRVILNGIDFAEYADFEPGTATVEPPVDEAVGLTLGTVGRLAPEKGIHRLLDAFSVLRSRSPKLRLNIVGDGPERGRLERRAVELGLGDSVTFAGYRSDVRACLADFDLFVLPSITEGIPLALLEAMAAGLPLVASSVGGVPEVVRNESSGLLVPADDVDALVAACARLVNDPELRQRLGRGAVQEVTNRFRFSTMAYAYRALYEQQRTGWLRGLAKGVLRALPADWMIWSRQRAGSRVALTFDDGPDPKYSPLVLDILREHGVQATFFLVGSRIESAPELVRRMRDEGHEIGNHSLTHPQFERLAVSQARQEIERTNRIIQENSGQICRLFRPPYGKLCRSSVIGAWRSGLGVAMWSVDLKDYSARTAEQIRVRQEMRPIRDGDVVLYHGESDAAVEALPGVISWMRTGGRQAVTLSEMIS